MSDRLTEVRVRRLEAGEIVAAFPIIHELRAHLDLAEFTARTLRQSALGYELIGAFRGGVLVGVLGMRPVETLARGRHLHVDDLVIHEGDRGGGVGRALLEYAEQDAGRRGLGAVFLDSRREVIGFYEHLGYEPHTSPLMRKRLVGSPGN